MAGLAVMIEGARLTIAGAEAAAAAAGVGPAAAVVVEEDEAQDADAAEDRAGGWSHFLLPLVGVGPCAPVAAADEEDVMLVFWSCCY